MSWDLALRHAAALRSTVEQTRVSLELLSSQLAGLESFAKSQQRPTATIATHEHCAAYGEQCALINEDAKISKASMAHPQRWVCSGCRNESHNGVTLATT